MEYTIAYPDGTPVRVGDQTIMNQGREPGVVVEVVDSPEKIEQSGAEEPGILVDLTPGGLNFWPLHALAFEDEIGFVSTGANAGRPRLTADQKPAPNCCRL